MIPRRLNLLHAPTPIVKRAALDELIGVDLWIKRDDATGGAEAGNKLRKLEFLMAQALDHGAAHIVTCGGLQSNHARATAIVSAQLGLGCTLLLRVADAPPSGLPGPDVDAPSALLPVTGNVLLARAVGAHVRLITPRQYDERSACMEKVAADLRDLGKRAYVVPEGGSNGLGALGYVEAMREVREQLDLGLAGGKAFDVIVHATGSGGTAAGIALGAGTFGVARAVRTFAVCDDRAYFDPIIARIVREATAHDPTVGAPAALTVDDSAKGPAYAVMSADQRQFLARVAKASGLITDPVYTGKALFGLAAAVRRGDIAKGARVLFVHTGGLPGLLADGRALAGEL
jgi:D-cysteine desulfhydrase